MRGKAERQATMLSIVTPWSCTAWPRDAPSPEGLHTTS